MEVMTGSWVLVVMVKGREDGVGAWRVLLRRFRRLVAVDEREERRRGINSL